MLSRGSKFGAVTEIVDPQDFEEKYKNFSNFMNEASYPQNEDVKIPVSLTEVKDFYGKCFHLQTRAFASTEQQYQGWKINLAPDLEYNIYLSYDVPFFYFTKVAQEFFVLEKQSQTFVRFKRR